MHSFNILPFLLCIGSAAIVTAKPTGNSAKSAPRQIADTTALDNPFFLRIGSTEALPYLNRVLQIDGNATSMSSIVVDPASPVAGFQLVNGSFQTVGKPKAYAKFVPLPTIGQITRHSLSFTTEDPHVANWTLIHTGKDLYALFPKQIYGAENTFALCGTSTADSYTMEYQSGKTTATTKGCKAVYLQTEMGPPY